MQLATLAVRFGLETTRTVVETARAAVLECGTRIDASMLRLPRLPVEWYNEDEEQTNKQLVNLFRNTYFICKAWIPKKGICWKCSSPWQSQRHEIDNMVRDKSWHESLQPFILRGIS